MSSHETSMQSVVKAKPYQNLKWQNWQILDSTTDKDPKCTCKFKQANFQHKGL